MPAGREGPSLACDLPLGRPGLTVHNRLVLRGWAVSPRGISGVAVQIGDRQWNASYGLDTPATAQRWPDLPGVAHAGYELRIDTSAWEAGPHYVTVAAFDREGDRAAVEGSVGVLPFEPAPATAAARRAAVASGGVALVLDERPGTTDGDPLEVSGWAHSSAGLEAITVTGDDRHRLEALWPVDRPDLATDHDGEVGAGFASRLDESLCPPGRHSLVVVAVARDGRAAGLEREFVVPDAAENASTALSTPAVQPGPSVRHWQDRALLAEADAAVSRTEAELARKQEERTAWKLRQSERQLATLRGELDAVHAERDSAAQGSP